MKAILVIDMPDDVSLDEWFATKVVVDRLKATEEELIYGIPFVESKLFRFVPLRPLPQKTYAEFPDSYKYGFADGWNKCLEELQK